MLYWGTYAQDPHKRRSLMIKQRNTIQFNYEPEPTASDIIQDALTHPGSDQQPETD